MVRAVCCFGGRQAGRGVDPDPPKRRSRVISSSFVLLIAAAVASAAVSFVYPSDAYACAPSTPINTAPPQLSGSAEVGRTLITTNGAWWSCAAIAEYSYQWFRDTQPIASATAASYTLTPSDAGRILFARVTATDILERSASADSNSVQIASTVGIIELNFPAQAQTVSTWASSNGLTPIEVATSWRNADGQVLSAGAEVVLPNAVTGAYGDVLKDALLDVQADLQGNPDVPAAERALVQAAIDGLGAGDVPVDLVIAAGTQGDFDAVRSDPNARAVYTRAEWEQVLYDPNPADCDPVSNPDCPDDPTDPPAGAGAAATSSATQSTPRCGAPWGPWMGTVETGPAPRYPTELRRVFTTFRWGATRLANLQACSKGTFELDVVYDETEDGDYYLGRDAPTDDTTFCGRVPSCKTYDRIWLSNMENDYRDTRLFDRQTNPGTRTFTVGTDDVGKLQAHRLYWWWYRAVKTDARTDRGFVNGQRGQRKRIPLCRVMGREWCVVGRESRRLIKGFQLQVPGKCRWEDRLWEPNVKPETCMS